MMRLAGGALFVAGALVACGGGKGKETGPEYLYPDEAGFCAALGEAECSDLAVKACYGSDQSTLAEDRAACQAARSSRCNPLGLPYHPELAEDCITTRQQALEDAVWTKAEIAAVEAACAPVFSKEGPDGASCTADTDCDAANGLRCVVKLNALSGVCGKPVVVAGGEDCSDPLAVCEEVYYCDPQVSHCLKRPEMDQACSSGVPCSADYYCTDVDAGTCLVKAKNGLDCTKDELCQGGFCVGATDTAPGKCSATLPLQLNADSCDVYRQ